jgi:hypothetical protein
MPSDACREPLAAKDARIQHAPGKNCWPEKPFFSLQNARNLIEIRTMSVHPCHFPNVKEVIDFTGAARED